MKFKVREHFLNFNKMSYVKEDDNIVKNNSRIIDCSYGTNPYGYSNLINDKNIQLKSMNINGYPQYPYLGLRNKILNYWTDIGLTIENIRVGSGAMGVMSTLIQLFSDESSPILGYSPQFTDFITVLRSLGGKYESIVLKQENNYKFNADDIINNINEKHSVIYIDNPNNPTGQIIPLTEISKIVKKAEKMNICVLVDEAYGDFMSKDNSAINIVSEFSNVFVAKSFSKGFGIAGLRIGYAIISKELLEQYLIVETPFSVDEIANEIAKVAISDVDFINNSIKNIRYNKNKFTNSITKLKVLETSMETPIMVLKHPNNQVDLYNLFLENNILAESGRDFIGIGQDYVRLRIPAEIDELIRKIKIIESNI